MSKPNKARTGATPAARKSQRPKAQGTKPTGTKPTGTKATGKARGARPTARKSGAARSLAPKGRTPDSAAISGSSTGHVVIGRISPATRAAGALGLLAAVGLAVRPFLPLALDAGGSGLGRTAGVPGLLGWLPQIVLLAAAGVCCLRGVLPRLGLTVIGAGGALSIGIGLRALWLLDTHSRSVLDLPVGGQALRGQTYQIGSGLILELVVAGLLVLALLCVLAGWTATVMEDGGPFDRYRPAFGVFGFFLGVFAAVCFSLTPSNSPVGIAPDTVTGQSGLNRIGGLLLAAAVVVCCIVASSVRPWLGTIGVFLGVFGPLFGLAIENYVVVGRSPDLTASFGAGAEVAAALLVLLTAVVAAAVRGTLPGDIPGSDQPRRAQGSTTEGAASEKASQKAAQKQKSARVGG